MGCAEGAADRGTARQIRRDTRANSMPHPGTAITKTDSRADTEPETSNTPESHKHLKSVVLDLEAERLGEGPQVA